MDRVSDVESKAPNPGATEAQLAAAELELGVSLPEDYRAFLAHNDGWPGMWDFQWFSLDQLTDETVQGEMASDDDPLGITGGFWVGHCRNDDLGYFLRGSADGCEFLQVTCGEPEVTSMTRALTAILENFTETAAEECAE